MEVASVDGLGELVIERGKLPEDARHADAVLKVSVESGTLVDALYDEAETTTRTEEAQSRFDRLSRRLGSAESDDVNKRE